MTSSIGNIIVADTFNIYVLGKDFDEIISFMDPFMVEYPIHKGIF